MSKLYKMLNVITLMQLQEYRPCHRYAISEMTSNDSLLPYVIRIIFSNGVDE